MTRQEAEVIARIITSANAAGLEGYACDMDGDKVIEEVKAVTARPVQVGDAVLIEHALGEGTGICVGTDPCVSVMCGKILHMPDDDASITRIGRAENWERKQAEENYKFLVDSI